MKIHLSRISEFPSKGTIDSVISLSVSVAWNFIITLYRIAERYYEDARGERRRAWSRDRAGSRNGRRAREASEGVD